MEKGGGERGRDEDLTDWTPGGNLQKAAISGKKGKCEVTQGGGKGRRKGAGGRARAALDAEPQGRRGKGRGVPPGSGLRLPERRKQGGERDVGETVNTGRGEEARDKSETCEGGLPD